MKFCIYLLRKSKQAHYEKIQTNSGTPPKIYGTLPNSWRIMSKSNLRIRLREIILVTMSQQPTFHITKEHFVGVINSLHEQFVKDKQCSESFSQIFHAEAGFYDNSALINAVFSFLHEVFPKDEDGYSEINHYCYCLDFGKNGEEYESPEELYNRLMLAKGIMWFDTPDKGPVWYDYRNPSEGGINLAPKQIDDIEKQFEDSFLSNGIDQLILWKNQEKTAGGKPSYLIDEAGQFPSDAMEMQKKYWQHVVSERAKPSPDENA